MQLDANFESLWDSESPITEILLAAFEDNYSEISFDDRRQISEWFNVGSVTKASVFLSIPLQAGRKYFVQLRATNAAGHSVTCKSNGVIIDLTPPSAGNVNIVTGNLKVIDTRSGLLQLVFDGFYDSESEIQTFVWSVVECPVHDGVEIETCKTISSGSVKNRHTANILVRVQLKAGCCHYQARITARDRAGNEISASSESLPASADDLIYPVASRIFDDAPTVFKSLLDAEKHIDEVILPRLSSEVNRDSKHLRWCIRAIEKKFPVTWKRDKLSM